MVAVFNLSHVAILQRVSGITEGFDSGALT